MGEIVFPESQFVLFFHFWLFLYKSPSFFSKTQVPRFQSDLARGGENLSYLEPARAARSVRTEAPTESTELWRETFFVRERLDGNSREIRENDSIGIPERFGSKKNTSAYWV
jgi:hypothetical protein